MSLKNELMNELDYLIGQVSWMDSSFKMTSGGSYESDVPEADLRALATGAKAAIRRIAGEKSEYYLAIPSLRDTERISVPGYSPTLIPALRGTLVALRRAVDAGLLESLEVRLRANVHDDFLEQAQSLLAAGYHVAAMVLTGGVLEDHLRKMCAPRGLAWKGDGSLAKYNDLLRDNPYPQTVWRRIQAIGDVRNEAAHGNGHKVKEGDVRDAHEYVRRFLADYPS